MKNNKKKSKQEKGLIGNGFFKEKYKKIMEDSLYKNSIYLMISSAVMAGFGFFFWLICARLFSAEDIGLATTIISVMGLIASISVLGLNSGLIRYLPTSKDKSKNVNTCFTIVALIAIIVSCIFLLGLNKFSPRLMFIKQNIILSFAFIFFMVIYSMNSIIESVFMAIRRAKFILVKNTIFSVLKLVIPFVFIALGIAGAFGIFSAYMSAMLIGFGVVFLILVYKFKYKPKFVFYDDVITKIGKYSFVLYLAGFIGGLTTSLMPLIITNMLHPETTAYYYIAMQIVSLIFIISGATTNSLFAEGSYNQKSLKKNVQKSIWIISILLIPAILLTFLFGNFILEAFGEQYSTQGLLFLKVMALSAILVSINNIFGSVFKVKKKIWGIMTRNIIGTVVTLGLSFILIREYELMGIAYAYIIGQAVTAIAFWIMWKCGKKKDKLKKKTKKKK